MEEENPIIKELEGFLKITGGRQREFYAQMLHDAQPIKIVSIYDVFSRNEINAIKRTIKPKPKMCYKNASMFTKVFNAMGYDVQYVEGKATVFGSISFDHAFNKIDGKYVDITLELGCGKSFDEIQKEHYVSLIECSMHELVNMELQTGVYGNIYPEKFINGQFCKG